MFIIPLVGVFVAAFFGVTSERMALVTKKRTGGQAFTAVLSLLGLFFSISLKHHETAYERELCCRLCAFAAYSSAVLICTISTERGI